MPKYNRSPQGLSPRQRRFIEEYLICMDCTEAARRVGYKFPNTQGPRTRRLPAVEAAIEAVFAERKNAKRVDAERVLAELAEIAFAPKGEVNNREKVASLNLLGKHVGLFSDRMELTGRNGGPIELDKHGAAARIAALMEKARRRKGGDEG